MDGSSHGNYITYERMIAEKPKRFVSEFEKVCEGRKLKVKVEKSNATKCSALKGHDLLLRKLSSPITLNQPFWRM